jgi:hypothetical protein
MKTRGCIAVRHSVASSFAALLVAVAAVENVGCVNVSGGAAELSWSLRDSEGLSLGGVITESCTEANIGEVRLCWQLLVDGGSELPQCRPGNFRDFACEDGSGVTGFTIPPGRASLFVQPICDSGEPAVVGSFDVPPPIVRQVEEGQVVTLNSLLIVVNRTNCCTGDPEDMSCTPCTCR